MYTFRCAAYFEYFRYQHVILTTLRLFSIVLDLGSTYYFLNTVTGMGMSAFLTI